MTLIKVPATSANLGPGFDSLGIAISVYLELEILEPAARWSVEHTLGSSIPMDEKNMIIQTALSIAPELQPHRLKMKSAIPPARGLGSSSAAIVAGIELANQLADLHLTNDDKIQIGSRLEGHPDNIMPAVVGGCTVGTMLDQQVYWSSIPFPQVSLVVTVPDRELLTAESRSVLPSALSLAEATKGSSVANLLIAALHQGDVSLMGKMMEQDVFHEPYRSALVPELQAIRSLGRELGAYGTYLSGAGSTIMTIASDEVKEQLVTQLSEKIPTAEVFLASMERKGVRVL